MSSGFLNGIGIVNSLTSKVVESIYGNSEQIDVTHVEFEWEIPDFYRLEKTDTKELQSPEFQCFGAKWHIILRKQLSPPLWQLFLFKNFLNYPHRPVYYSVGTKKVDGTVQRTENGTILPAKYPVKVTLVPTKLEISPRGKTETAVPNVLLIFCHMSLTEIPSDTVAHFRRFLASKNSNKKMETPDSLNVCCQNMKDMLHKQLFCDWVIKVKDEEFRSHKAVLAARSDVFHAMFQSGMAETRSGVTKITDYEPDVFREFLVYLYSGDIDELSTERICGVYSLADMYDVPELKLNCVAIMRNNINVHNFCDIISLALLHEESDLLKKASLFFKSNTSNILQSEEWKTFLAEKPTVANELLLKKICSSDDKL